MDLSAWNLPTARNGPPPDWSGCFEEALICCTFFVPFVASVASLFKIRFLLETPHAHIPLSSLRRLHRRPLRGQPARSVPGAGGPLHGGNADHHPRDELLRVHVHLSAGPAARYGWNGSRGRRETQGRPGEGLHARVGAARGRAPPHRGRAR